ncbi:TetR family transcriptional regulator [Kribbella ginsengisoli]|uniref:TetR family transcriptional regulator n=1 Tax=Kribbella ginsengisoli TaxID=363865 RepID=UPI0031D2A9F4
MKAGEQTPTDASTRAGENTAPQAEPDGSARDGAEPSLTADAQASPEPSLQADAQASPEPEPDAAASPEPELEADAAASLGDGGVRARGGAEVPDGRRRRLTAEDRRKQLVGIGLMMLRTQPIHELSIDAVAAEAGISRGLLFHYFPTKRDFYVEVMSAAGRRLLRVTKPDPDLPPDEQLRQMLLSFVAFVTRRRDSYISFVRGAAGGDNFVVEVYATTRAGLTNRVLTLLGTPDATAPASPIRLTVHAWLAYVEDLTIEWSGLPEPDRPTTPDELVTHFIAALTALRAL